MAPHRALVAALVTLLLPSITLAQTAGPYPTLVYSYQPGTGSVDPSLTAALTTANAPALSLLNSQGSDSETAPAPTFQTTATVGPTTASEVLTSFTFTSGTPMVVLSSNTRPDFTASGTIVLTTGSQGATQSPNAAARLGALDWRGAWGMAVVGTAGALAGALLL